MTTPPPDLAAVLDLALSEAADAPEPALFDVFSRVAAYQPDHLAVDDGTSRLTYAELRDQALALGARIGAEVAADGLVGVILPISVLYPVAWLACLAARRPFLPFDPYLPPARNQAILAEAGLAAAIVPTTTGDLSAWLPSALPRIAMDVSGTAPASLQAGLPPSKISMVLFTSGSTGPPKGIVPHERSHLRRAMNYRTACDLGPADRLLSLHPPSTSAGVRDTFGALLCGATLCLADLKSTGLAGALTPLRDGGVTVCATVPALARALVAIDGAAVAFRGLRIMRLSGETVMGSDIASLASLLPPAARILLVFGMTEAADAVAQRMIDPHAPIETGRLGVGVPLAGQMVSVEDASGAPVRHGEVGELVLRGRDIALGRWVGGKLDTAAFPDDPLVPGSRCYSSGDRVLLRSDGMLVPIGRTDRQVKINGVRVEPENTEAALRSLPGVADAAVLVHGDAAAPLLVAFVVPIPGEHAARDLAEQTRGWRAALAVLLPPQEVPALIRMISAVPLLPSQKPDLAALRVLLLAEARPGAFFRFAARVRRAWTAKSSGLVRLARRRGGAVP